MRTRVAAIRMDSSAAVAALADIGAVIDQIDATQTAIADVVGQRTATANEMGRNVGEVAAGSQEISSPRSAPGRCTGRHSVSHNDQGRENVRGAVAQMAVGARFRSVTVRVRVPSAPH